MLALALHGLSLCAHALDTSAAPPDDMGLVYKADCIVRITGPNIIPFNTSIQSQIVEALDATMLPQVRDLPFSLWERKRARCDCPW